MCVSPAAPDGGTPSSGDSIVRQWGFRLIGEKGPCANRMHRLQFKNKCCVCTMRCTYHAYPKTEVTVVIDEQSYLMCVGGVDQLLVDIIFGTGLRMIFDLLQKTERHNGNKGVMFNS